MPFPPALLLLAFPLLELVGLIAAGQAFGALPVLAWVFASAAIGVFILCVAGWTTARGVQAAMLRGEVPLADMLSGAALSMAAILLIVPGFITDVLGLLLLIGPLRRGLDAVLSGRAAPPPSASGGTTIIEGEFSVVADPPPADPLPPPDRSA